MEGQPHNPVLRHAGSPAPDIVQVVHDVPVRVDGLRMTRDTLLTPRDLGADLEDPGPGAPDLILGPGGSRAPGHIPGVKLRARVRTHVMAEVSKLLTPR